MTPDSGGRYKTLMETMRTRSRRAVTVLLLTVLGWSISAQAPQVAAPPSADKALALSLARALDSWMEKDRAAKGGKFLLHDAVAREVLDLTIAKLDDGDHLHRLDDGRFLSWGEFVDTVGRKYLIDFYFRRADASFLFDHEITIYSRDGVKRYAWDESGPTMKKVPVK